ncbi:MAG: metalloregulator ArsR/SmtB family transcription factor [Candidatus Poribacteria bacterium]
MEKEHEKLLYELHAEICKTLSNAKRLQIIDVLRHGEMPVGELALKTGIRIANVSQHLAIMNQKGILKRRREGLNIYYSIAHPKVVQAFDIMREVLLEKLEKQAKIAENVAK